MELVLSGYTKIFDEEYLRNLFEKDGDDLPAGQKKMLIRMLETGPTRYLVKPSNTKCLDPVIEKCPNFSEVIETLNRYLALAIDGEEHLSFPPILLLGDAGVGKTHFASQLAKCLGVEKELIAMSSMTAGWILSGAAHSWSGAKPGRVAKKLVDGAVANPLMIVDEIDKAGGEQRHDPLGSLYQLMEKETASSFKDEYLDVPLDCSFMNWVCTANYVQNIPKPILSRMRVFEIKKPTKDQMRTLAQNIYSDLIKEHSWKVENSLRDDVLDILSELEARTLKKALWESLGESKLSGKSYVCKDVLSKLLAVTKQKEKSPIGFTH